MDQGSSHSPIDIMSSPRDIRDEIAKTREELSRHLDALRTRVFHLQRAEGPQTEATMPTKKASRRPSPPSRDDGSKNEGTKKSKKAASAKGSDETKTTRKKAAASSSAKKGSTSAKKGSTSRTKSASKSKAKGLVAKTGEALDTALAGAVVGAVTGAARSLANEPTAVTPPGTEVAGQTAAAGSKPPTTGEVLEEMAPAAALGAVSGTVKAIAPAEPAGGKKKRKR